MAKSSPPNRTFWYIFGAASLLVFGYFYSQDDAVPVRKTKRVVASQTKKATDEFLPIDYKAKFSAYTESTKDAFKPLIIRSSDAGQGVGAVPNGGIPLSYTAGEPNWNYTGVAYIDGVPHALLDNSGTGEGVFIKAGDHWKSSSVLTVTQDSVVLQDKEGVAKQIRLAVIVNKDDEATNGNGPLKPPLSGAIGGVSVNPIPGGAPGIPGFGGAASGGIEIGN
jgi:hypothetical protein